MEDASTEAPSIFLGFSILKSYIRAFKISYYTIKEA